MRFSALQFLVLALLAILAAAWTKEGMQISTGQLDIS